MQIYFVDVLIPRHSQFKFVIDGQYLLSDYYPRVKVIDISF